MSYPFDKWDDPFYRYEERDPSPDEVNISTTDYCIYLRDKKTGELVKICDSDLPF